MHEDFEAEIMKELVVSDCGRGVKPACYLVVYDGVRNGTACLFVNVFIDTVLVG